MRLTSRRGGLILRFPSSAKHSALLQKLQTFAKIRIFVVIVERIASRRKAVARRGCAIAESAADSLMLNWLAPRSLPKQFRIGQHHSAQSDHVDPALAHDGLRHIGKEILQIGISRSHEDQIGETLFQQARHFHLPTYINQRILRRLVSIRRRKERWPLNMRAVVGAASGDVHESYIQLLEQG